MSSVVEIHDNNIQPVTVSAAALAHIENQIAKRGGGIGMRLSLTKTGCSGLSYVVDIIDAKNADDIVFPINDTLSVFIPHKDLPHLQGTEIDFTKQGLNQQFIYHNPNAKADCGCGSSFSVE